MKQNRYILVIGFLIFFLLLIALEIRDINKCLKNGMTTKNKELFIAHVPKLILLKEKCRKFRINYNMNPINSSKTEILSRFPKKSTESVRLLSANKIYISGDTFEFLGTFTEENTLKGVFYVNKNQIITVKNNQLLKQGKKIKILNIKPGEIKLSIDNRTFTLFSFPLQKKTKFVHQHKKTEIH